MTEQKIKVWKEKKNDVKEARSWNNLPFGKKYSSTCDFNISEAHCSRIMLMRAGQQVVSGNNYWESPKGLNVAIMKYIVSNWDDIFPIILADMAQMESDALKDCQSYVDEMQKLISEA